MPDSEQSLEPSVFRSLLENVHSVEADAHEVSEEQAPVEGVARIPSEPDSDGGWRNERYRLLSEIDHLRATLDRMRGQVDQADRFERQFHEVQCYNEELEARWQQHVGAPESVGCAKRTSKESRIEEPEDQVVEMREETSNRDRNDQALREKLETRLEVTKRSLEIEAERRLRSSEIQWNRERLQLVGEIENLKRKLTAHGSLSLPSKRSLVSRFLGRQPAAKLER